MRRSALPNLLTMLVGCGSAPASVAEPTPPAEPTPVVLAEAEPADEPPPEMPDGCFATACERAYFACVDGAEDVDCNGPYAACIETACADVEPIEIAPTELRDILFSIGDPERALAACPAASDELDCAVAVCAATTDGRHEACVIELQSMDEEGTTYALAVRDGRRWARVIPVIGRAVDPASMTSSWVDRPELRWTEGEGGPWLTLRWSPGFTDADWCSGAGGSDTMVALCAPRDGRTVCVAALRTSARMEASTGRIDLEEESDPLERWTTAQPIFDVLFAPDGRLVWVDRPALLDGVDTPTDLAARAEGLPALGER